jgi:hypothetical protein
VMFRTAHSVSLSRVDRVAAALGRPPEDVKNAMRKHAAFRSGPDEGRIAALSVRLSNGRHHRRTRPGALEHVAHELDITPERLRFAMRSVAYAEGREQGVWTMSVRVW